MVVFSPSSRGKLGKQSHVLYKYAPYLYHFPEKQNSHSNNQNFLGFSIRLPFDICIFSPPAGSFDFLIDFHLGVSGEVESRWLIVRRERPTIFHICKFDCFSFSYVCCFFSSFQWVFDYLSMWSVWKMRNL